MDNIANECKLCSNYNFNKVAVEKILGQYEICLQSCVVKETNFKYCPLCGRPIANKTKAKSESGEPNKHKL